MTKIIESSVYLYLDDDALEVKDNETERKAFIERNENDVYLTFLNADGRTSFCIRKEFAENIAKAILEKAK